MAGDRGRDTSIELTEVRRILSGAETAYRRLIQLRDGALVRYRQEVVDGRVTYVDDRTADPDIDAMIADLQAAATVLDRWRRTGRRTT